MRIRLSKKDGPVRWQGSILYKLLLLLIVVGWTHSAAAAFQIRSLKKQGRACVYLTDVATYYGMTLKRADKTVTLKRKNQTLKLTLDRREAWLDGVKVHLSFAPFVDQGILLLSAIDLVHMLDPLLRDWGLPTHSVARIVLDPGHGGKDNGGEGRSMKEKNLTLPLALQVKAILESRGYQVFLTRETDVFVSLSQRAAKCRKWQGDIFVSIHANKAASHKASGIETFILAPSGTASTASTRRSYRQNPGNASDQLNTLLGFELQRYLLAATGAEDRGLKHARFQVLREACCPAALVETGFLSNRAEEKKLGKATYQKRIAIGIANGIISFHRILVLGRSDAD